MADNQETQGSQGLSEETARLAALGRGEEVSDSGASSADANADAAKSQDQKPQRPDHVPEKFWNAETGAVNTEALLKSYTELEKLRGKKQEEANDGDGSGGDPDGDLGSGDDAGDPDDGAGEVAGAISAELFTSAQTEWAEKGELTAETREKIISSGIPAETLDTYLAGVAALSEALTRSVYEAAGGEDAYKAAVEWARENWSEKQIEKFDAAISDQDLMPVMVKALMADYSGANPGEGTQTRGGVGTDGGDLYHDPAEFTRDLTEADTKNDPLLRKKAVQKLERSKKAGTLKHVTPRTGVSSLLG